MMQSDVKRTIKQAGILVAVIAAILIIELSFLRALSSDVIIAFMLGLLVSYSFMVILLEQNSRRNG